MYVQTWGYTVGTGVWADVKTELDFLKTLKTHLGVHNIRITYRLRSEERISDYSEQIINHSDLRFEEGNKISAHDSILDQDIIISTGSTMVLEALALKKYAILLDRKSQDTYGFGRSGACLVGSDSKEVAEAVDRIIVDKKQRANLSTNAIKYVSDRAMIDGKSSERTVMFIKTVINNTNYK